MWPTDTLHAQRHTPRVGRTATGIVEDAHSGTDPRNHELPHSYPVAERDAHPAGSHARTFRQTVRPDAASLRGHLPPQQRPAPLHGELPQTDPCAPSAIRSHPCGRAFRRPEEVVRGHVSHLRPTLSRFHVPSRPLPNRTGLD